VEEVEKEECLTDGESLFLDRGWKRSTLHATGCISLDQ
jgi:hypothetical protein